MEIPEGNWDRRLWNTNRIPHLKEIWDPHLPFHAGIFSCLKPRAEQTPVPWNGIHPRAGMAPIIPTLIMSAPKTSREGMSYKGGIRVFQGMVPEGGEGGTQTPLIPIPCGKIGLHPIPKEQRLEQPLGHQEQWNFLGFRRKELEIFPLFLVFSPRLPQAGIPRFPSLPTCNIMDLSLGKPKTNPNFSIF